MSDLPIIADEIYDNFEHFLSIYQSILDAMAKGDAKRAVENYQKLVDMLPYNPDITETERLRRSKIHAYMLLSVSVQNAYIMKLPAGPLADALESGIRGIDEAKTLAEMRKALTDRFVTFADQIRDSRSMGNSDIVRSATQYISRHLGDPVNEGQLAEKMGISVRQLSRLFNSQLGCTPYHYILNKKLQAAIYLMMHSDYTISKISDKLSFSSHGHFSRLFKKYTGQTPTDFKKSHESHIEPDRVIRASEPGVWKTDVSSPSDLPS